jgi:hypothetical protein
MSENGKDLVTVKVPAEVGEQVVLDEIQAIYLGTVSDGKELDRAMRLMALMEKERLGQPVSGNEPI